MDTPLFYPAVLHTGAKWIPLSDKQVIQCDLLEQGFEIFVSLRAHVRLLVASLMTM